MSEALIFIIIAGAIGAALVFIFKNKRARARKADEQFKASLPVQLPDTFPYFYNTPQGARVFSAVEIKNKQEVFAAIDGGILNQLTATKAKFPNWNAARRVSDYSVMFIEPEAVSAEGYPCLLIGGVKSAGTVIGIGEGYSTLAIVLPHQEKTGWSNLDYLFNSAWYESEHFAEFANDREVFMQYTGLNDVHPHHELPPENRVQSLISAARPKVKCGVNL